MGGSVYSKDTEKEAAFTQYRRTQIAEMRPYVLGEVLPDSVSISAVDRASGSPVEGDMIARNPVNHADQWLVAKEYFAANFEPLTIAAPVAPAAESATQAPAAG